MRIRLRDVRKILGTGLFFFLFAMNGAVLHAEEGDVLPETVAAPEPRAPSERTNQVNEDKKNYRIQFSDRLNLKIYPEDPYIKGGEFQVTPEGNVTLPLLGKVRLSGMTIREAVEMLEHMIDKDYLVDPEVTIEILESKQKSFVILGEVKKPGTYQFPAGATGISLLEAISMAGGFSDIANIKKVRILRQEPSGKRTIRANAQSIISGGEPDIQLQEGDVVNVDESLF